MKFVSFLAATLAGLPAALAQDIPYTTSTVTACFDRGPGFPTPTPDSRPPGHTCVVEIPGCGACDCASCVHTKTYTTVYPAFCSTGVIDVTYTVKELYTGMTSAPKVTGRPSVPKGFTTAVETCTVCGDEPLTKTMTYPVDGAPYVPIETAVAEHLDQAASHKPCSGPGCDGTDDDTTKGRPVGGTSEGEDHVEVAGSPARFVRDMLLAAVPLAFAF